jgi:CheY-like chemotaxis protein
MPDGGNLTVTTGNVILTGDDAHPGENLVPGKYVLLSVSDDGAGMSPEVQAHAFEPFFTTKGHGKGTGLGLSTIYGFVRQSGGHVKLTSEIGHGTTVSIYLPAIDAEEIEGRAAICQSPPPKPGGEMILVVEDSPQVRRVTVERLLALGYRAMEAESGQQALDILERGETVDLVFSDVVMPGGISGFDLAHRIRGRWPSLNVLLTSGYAPDVGQSASDAARYEILSKPYSQAALEQAVGTALHGKSGQASKVSIMKI